MFPAGAPGARGPGAGPLRATFAGLGARESLEAGGHDFHSGSVLASFPKACYLRVAGGIAGLVAPEVQPGPLSVGLDGPPPRLKPGDSVRVGPGTLASGAWRLDLAGAPIWTGALPSPDDAAAAIPAVLDALAPLARACLVPQERAAVARNHLAAGNVQAAADVLAGSGPGLTPAGDDALAGILFARRALGLAPAGELEAVARSVRTTDLATAFLLWAARGQALAPVHDLLGAAVTGDLRATRRAAAALGAIGHSSGADIAQGLCWGLGQLSPARHSQSVHSKDSGPSNLGGPNLPH